MTTLLPSSQTCSQVEAYEDMFKEITRKLYGDASEANQSTTAPVLGSIIPDVERSFTNLVILIYKNRYFCFESHYHIN